MVAAPRLRQRDEFPERGEGGEGEEHQHADLAEEEGDPDQEHHHPPGPDALVEVLDQGIGLRPLALRQDEADRGRHGKDGADAEEEEDRLLGRRHGCAGSFGRSDSSDARARSRKTDFSSPSRSRIGSPKATVQTIGTGISSPFGITRLRLAIQTGTISTPGCARQSR